MKAQVELCCSFNLEVAHFMPNFPEGHPNSRMHGHSYLGKLHLKGGVDPSTGVLMEFSQLKTIVDEVVAEFDHRPLNEVPGLELPTTENLLTVLWERLHGRLPGLSKITLSRPTVGIEVSFSGEMR